MKRLILDNTGPGGSLDTDKVLRGILQYRNTPDPVTGLSPAEVVFGRQIRDFTPVLPGKYRPRDEWRDTLRRREEALTRRHFRDHERWSEHTQKLKQLKVGDSVYIQNQTGNHARRWDKSGVVIEVRQHDQYLVKKDGSGIPTLRNRKFLRKFTPYNISMRSPLPKVTQPVTTKPEVSATPDVSSRPTPQETCRDMDLPPKLTPNRKFSDSLVHQSPTAVQHLTPAHNGNNVGEERSPERIPLQKSPVSSSVRNSNNSLPRTRLDLSAEATYKDDVKITRSGRVSKPVDRYQCK